MDDVARRVWLAAGDELGLTPGSYVGEHGRFLPQLNGTVDEVPVTVRATVSTDEDDAFCGTQYNFSLGDDPPWETLSIHPGDRWVRGWWPFRLGYVTFDDPEFDNAFAVKCDDREALRLRLDAWHRSKIRELADRNPDWTVTCGEISRWMPGVATANEIISIVTAHVELVRAITSP
jgi:hypothetical protein